MAKKRNQKKRKVNILDLINIELLKEDITFIHLLLNFFFVGAFLGVPKKKKGVKK